MIKIILTTEDGWHCASAIMEVSELLPQAGEMHYEIQHCKRSTSVKDMLYDLKTFLKDLQDRVDGCVEEYEGVEFQTIEGEES